MTTARPSGPAEPRIVVLPDASALNDAVASAIVESARESLLLRGRFTIALSGGETPRPVYKLLAGRHARDIEWSRVEVYFGDERCVPPDDDRSNYGMARDTLLSRVPIPPGQAYPMFAPGEAPADAAARYDALLRGAFPAMNAADPPTFDLALQGLGPDGHTASLFPGDPSLGEMSRWAMAVQAPATFPVRDRITLTPRALNRARRVLFMVAGASKREVVARVLRPGQTGAPDLPAAILRGLERTDWFMDAEAAGARS